MATATRYPTTDTAVSGTWVNPTNVQADDGNVASITRGTVKNSQDDREQGGYGFDSAIPVGATINRVDIEVEHRVQTTANVCFLENLAIANGVDGAVNSDSTEPTVLTQQVYSNYARPGGGAWTRNDLLDANFKTRIRARNGNNATQNTWEWDYIRITVDYTAATTETFTKTSDATLLRLEEFLKTSDARVLAAQDFTKTSDARLLLEALAFTRTSDAEIAGAGAVLQQFTKAADARLLVTQDFTKASDARLLQVLEFARTADARLLVTQDLVRASDARLQLLALEFAKTADARILALQELTKAADARILATTEFTRTSDAQIAGLATESFTKTSDAQIGTGSTGVPPDALAPYDLLLA